MPVPHLFPTERPSGTGLFVALHQRRDPAWSDTSECHVPERRAIDVNCATIERAKGALMRRYGVDTFEASSLMVRWARQAHTPVHTLAKTLVQGIDNAGPQPRQATPSADSLSLASPNTVDR